MFSCVRTEDANTQRRDEDADSPAMSATQGTGVAPQTSRPLVFPDGLAPSTRT